MNQMALELEKKLFDMDAKCIINPHSLFQSKDGQASHPLVKNRTTFIKFHEYIFSQSIEEITLLKKGYQKLCIDINLCDDSSVYVDMLLLKDAIDYQIALRDDKNFDIAFISSIASSWHSNVALASSYEEVTSDHLIDLAQTIKKQ